MEVRVGYWVGPCQPAHNRSHLQGGGGGRTQAPTKSLPGTWQPTGPRIVMGCLSPQGVSRPPVDPVTTEQGGIRMEGTSEAAPATVRQVVGGGCRSGSGRLLSVTNAIEVGTWRQGDSGWA